MGRNAGNGTRVLGKGSTCSSPLSSLSLVSEEKYLMKNEFCGMLILNRALEDILGCLQQHLKCETLYPAEDQRVPKSSLNVLIVKPVT